MLKIRTMWVKKGFGIRNIWRFSGHHILWTLLWCTIVTTVHEIFHAKWMEIPWLPISVIGTAVAFYVGFKNNQSYDRMWEARKIWGAIINSSRAWGSCVDSYITDLFTSEDFSETELYAIKKKLLYRHIGWLYALRSQLLIPTPWEHISQNKHMRKSTEKRQKSFGIGLLDDEDSRDKLSEYLPGDEYETLINYKNTATQIINTQSRDLRDLRKQEIIEDFRHMELQNILNDFYIHQGKAERIKKFPLPRQYAHSSAIFVGIFVFLLPFGMVTEFHKLGEYGPWISIIFSVIISWVFIMMELIGDYSENPFEGLGNDIPMLSLCRVIEIDLKEMLEEENIPPPIKAVNGVLM